MSQPPSGPITMAPMNIGIELPATIPMVATAPTRPPRGPCTSRPPVKPIRMGSRFRIIGSTSFARCLFGSHPAGRNKAEIRPQAMKAPMLGITIPAMNPPTFCNLALITG